MYGGNGQDLGQAFIAHYHLHFGKDPKKVLEKSNLDITDTLEMISGSNADVFGLCEVVGEEQAEKFKAHFESLGYKSVYRDTAQKKKSGLSIQIMLATRLKSEWQDDTKKFPRGGRPSQGGGIIHVYIPEIKTHVIHCHLLNPFQVMRMVRNQLQVVALEKVIQNIKKKEEDTKMIVMGDFNIPRHLMETLNPKLCSLKTLSNPRIPTYFNPANKNIRFIIDGIFGYNIDPHKSGVKPGKSDHRLVWAKVKMGEERER